MSLERVRTKIRICSVEVVYPLNNANISDMLLRSYAAADAAGWDCLTLVGYFCFNELFYFLFSPINNLSKRCSARQL